MKQGLSILLALLIFSVSVKDLSIYVAFKINQNYIAQNRCVNIDKPELECHGKCVLEKELKASKDQKDSFPASNPENKQLSPYFYSFVIVQYSPLVKGRAEFPVYQGLLSNPSLPLAFHPPQSAGFLV